MSTKKLTLLVTLEVEGDLTEMEAAVREYLTEPESPFLTDYGTDAWGGYTGPFVHKAKVQCVSSS